MQVILFDEVKTKRTSEINSFRLKSVYVWKAKRQAQERDICFEIFFKLQQNGSEENH